jgi:hypothetical protein
MITSSGKVLEYHGQKCCVTCKQIRDHTCFWMSYRRSESNDDAYRKEERWNCDRCHTEKPKTLLFSTRLQLLGFVTQIQTFRESPFTLLVFLITVDFLLVTLTMLFRSRLQNPCQGSNTHLQTREVA